MIDANKDKQHERDHKIVEQLRNYASVDLPLLISVSAGNETVVHITNQLKKLVGGKK